MQQRLARSTVGLLAVAVLLGYAQARAADPQAEQQKYLRFVEEKGGGRLETAVVTYTNAKGVNVHLVGAVHIGDTAYYEGLNKLFQKYDVLLYEMVKPKDAGMPGRGEKAKGVGIVHMIQKGLKWFLDLDYQLDGIDYHAKNFVHADLDAETFNRLQDERGESILGMMLQQMLREFMKGDRGAAAGRDGGLQDMDFSDFLNALAAPDSARQFKLILAKQFNNMDEMMTAFEGPNGSVLVTERNKAAIEVLKKELARGRKDVGIFYGAAHLKDFDKRLQEMGFKPVKTEWLVAWDLMPQGGAAAREPAREHREAKPDSRDEQIRKLQERIDQLEKRLQEQEKKRSGNR